MIQQLMANKNKMLKRIGNILLNVFYYSSIALMIIIALRVFVFSSFKIPTDSMEPSIVPGDYILVNKMAYGARIFNIFEAMNKKNTKINRVHGYTKVKRNDVIVFHMPHPDSWDKIEMDMMRYFIKRCIGVAGDTLRIVDGFYYINSDSIPQYGNLVSEKKLNLTPTDMLPSGIYHTFPWDSSLDWNIKDFGPLYIPRKGDKVELDRINSLLYKKVIEWERNSELEFKNDILYENDIPMNNYIFKNDYYFMGGDKVENSQDSRYWGFLPEEFIVGKALCVWKSVNPYSSKINWKRTMKKVE